jgi:hypothetical protein
MTETDGMQVNGGTARARRPRSAVTSGRVLLLGGNPNGAWARRFRDVCYLHLSDLGGPTAVSESKNSIIKRVATLTIECERLEAKFSIADEPSPESLDLYQRMSNTLRRHLEALGIKRRPRDITPSLEQYLEGKYGHEEA